MLHIVLLEPEIPQNTGNISRTCAVTGAELHLIGPMGFSIEDRWLKRAGLDYWSMLQVFYYGSWQAFRAAHPEVRPWMATSKGAQAYTQARYGDDAWLLFGKETHGLPEPLLAADYARTVRIPMREGARCLNLSNAVAVMAYEVMRQQDFAGLQATGALTGRPD